MSDENTLDPSQLVVEDVPTSAIPNHEASKEKKGWPKRTKQNTTSTKKKKSKPRSTKKGELVEPIENIYTTIGAFISPFDATCGNALIQNAHNCAITLDELARQNDAVRRALLALTQTNAIGAVIVAHAPIIMVVASHHVPAVKNTMSQVGEDLLKGMGEEMAAQQNGNGENN